MSNPLDDPDGAFLVLVNHENQYSLWPQPVSVPNGWRVVSGPASRQESLDRIEELWADMRPASLIRRMESGS